VVVIKRTEHLALAGKGVVNARQFSVVVVLAFVDWIDEIIQPLSRNVRKRVDRTQNLLGYRVNPIRTDHIKHTVT